MLLEGSTLMGRSSFGYLLLEVEAAEDVHVAAQSAVTTIVEFVEET